MRKELIIFRQISDRYYKGENGYAMRLCEDKKTESVNGNSLYMLWMLLDEYGKMIDYDKYRYDLAGRNGIQLKS